MGNLERAAAHEHRSDYNQDLNDRLQKFCNASGEDYSEVKQTFIRRADPYGLKPPYQAHDIYCHQLNKFLTEEGF